mmetsp:Transcript_12610/g.36233  ORF Transcript_12610/g.36233 Transcript_12610/m.36233 type:complete len:93 (+) Transcript_12610:55-333(+)
MLRFNEFPGPFGFWAWKKKQEASTWSMDVTKRKSHRLLLLRWTLPFHRNSRRDCAVCITCDEEHSSARGPCDPWMIEPKFDSSFYDFLSRIA